ncbi:MAG: hypothetical protein LBU43_07220 [Candidatus Accumulibacter sp.]|jgi:hypothetical protein|nr:hypothetical protein [Accumulibacter sp.]
MGIELQADLRAALQDSSSLKALASVDKNGNPHVVFKGSISLDETERNLQYLEIVETSQTNRNLVYSIWFKKKVAINVLTADGKSWQIKGVPVKAHISGPEFERQYVKLQELMGADADLSTVWIIEPVEETGQTLQIRVAEERARYPLIGHLDRFRA